MYTFSVDGEKLLLQFLLAGFALSFIYIICRSMRICEKQYNHTSKKITRLKARVDVVLAHHIPMCEYVLYHNIARYRQSLVAGYVKELIKEKQYEPEKYSNFFQNFPHSSSNRHASTCSTVPQQNFHSVPESNTNIFYGKERTSKGACDDLSNIEENITQYQENKLKGSRKNDFPRATKPLLDSKIFKTLEGPTRRMRSNLFEKKRVKISRWNTLPGLKTWHENLTVCSALTNTRLPFKIKSPYSKNPSQQKTYIDNTAPKGGKGKNSEKFDFNIPPITGDLQKLTKNKNDESFESEQIEQEVMENHSVGSSGCESDCESEVCTNKCLQVPFNSASSVPKTPLTTINEDSGEENCPSE